MKKLTIAITIVASLGAGFILGERSHSDNNIKLEAGHHMSGVMLEGSNDWEGIGGEITKVKDDTIELTSASGDRSLLKLSRIVCVRNYETNERFAARLTAAKSAENKAKLKAMYGRD